MRFVAILAALGLVACSPVVKARQAKVADLQVREAVRKYEAAQTAGDPLDLCVKAKLVAVAYEDADEAANAAAWRAREREACRLAMAAMGVTPPAASGR